MFLMNASLMLLGAIVFALYLQFVRGDSVPMLLHKLLTALFDPGSPSE
jgi:hypothetical protein